MIGIQKPGISNGIASMMYHLCKLRICVDNSFSSSSVTIGSPFAYLLFGDGSPDKSSRFKNCSIVRPASLANALCSSVISSSCLVFTLSGAIDCTVCSPSWATVFPHFLLPEWLLLEPYSSNCLFSELGNRLSQYLHVNSY